MLRNNELINELKITFSKENYNKLYADRKLSEHYFLFCNEKQFDKTIKKLEETTKLPTNSIRIAVLIGESNFMSMLPELSLHADVILLNDIDERVHQHTRHLLKCLKESKDRNEFKENYGFNHELIGHKIIYENGNPGYIKLENLWSRIEIAKKELGAKHFLSSDKRFKECRDALFRLNIENIWLDVFDLRACISFIRFLNTNRLILTLINLSNVHDYDDYDNLKLTVKVLSNHLTAREIKDYDLPAFNHLHHPIMLCSSMGNDIELISHLFLDIDKFMAMCKPQGAFEKIPVRIFSKILSFNNISDRTKFSESSKYLLNRRQFWSQNSKVERCTPFNYRLDDALTSVSSLFAQYKLNRKKQHGITSKFDYSSSHSKRLVNFGIDMVLFRDTALKLKTDQATTLRLTRNFGYQSKYDRAQYDTYKFKVQEDHYFIENLGSFLGFKITYLKKAKSYVSQVDASYQQLVIILIWRILFEMNYAINNKMDDYLRMLIHTAIIVMKCFDFIKFYDQSFQHKIKMQIRELRNDEFWNHCYVWKGAGRYFKSLQIADELKAAQEYSNGESFGTRSRTVNMEGHGFQSTETYVVCKGEESSLKYFYPYRERVDVWCNFLRIINQFIYLSHEYTSDDRAEDAFELMKKLIEQNAHKMQPTKKLSRGIYGFQNFFSKHTAGCDYVNRAALTIQKIYATCNKKLMPHEKIMHLILAIQTKLSDLIDKKYKGILYPDCVKTFELTPDDLKSNMPNQYKFIIAIHLAFEKTPDHFYNALIENFKLITDFDLSVINPARLDFENRIERKR